MSKAAQHQSIRRDDFLRVGPAAEPTAAFRAPNLPSLADGGDEDDELLDETIKLQPINIQARIVVLVLFVSLPFFMHCY